MPPRAETTPRRSPPPAPPGERSDDVRSAHTATALDAVRRIVRALRLHARSVEERTGLSAGQLFTLQLVGATPGLSLTELAERTMTDRTSVAGMVERLEARGLVERRAGTGDRRRAEIFATRRGRAVLTRAPAAPTQRLLDGLDALPEATLAGVAGSLETLARAMGLADEPARMLFDDGEPAPAAPATTRRRR